MIRPDNRLPSSVDVVVIGGGPAGTTAATLLAQRGYECLVLEHSQFPRYHIGESLIPHTYGTLDRLGMLPKLQESAFPVKHSVRFVSPDGDDSDPFYFSETIRGPRARTWQVERSQFDRLCLENAQAAGVQIRQGVRVSNLLMQGDRVTGIVATAEGEEPQDVQAKVVVDASGRAGVIGQHLGLKVDVPGLNKAAVWSYYQGGFRLPGIDGGETTVFMLPERGWFWYIPLPGDVVSVGVVASPDYLFRETLDFEAAFLAQVAACKPLGQRLRHATRVERVRGLRRMAYRHRQVVGNGWLMVGDAAGFLDPIYSSGLYLALASAELAAECIHDAIEHGDPSAERLGAYVPRLLKGMGIIRALIHAFYDPKFSFGEFSRRFPQHRAALIDCLVGDVVDRDMSPFLSALAEMTPPPEPW